jgi:hypothetical protein
VAFHSYVSPRGWTVVPLAAAVQRHRLTLSTWTTTAPCIWLQRFRLARLSRSAPCLVCAGVLNLKSRPPFERLDVWTEVD